jgi:hypothetical protein
VLLIFNVAMSCRCPTRLLHVKIFIVIPHVNPFGQPIVTPPAVSAAVGLLGDSTHRAQEWVVAVETILTIISNILKHPGELKYHQINVANPNFNRR